jgi:hypothetical protein
MPGPALAAVRLPMVAGPGSTSSPGKVRPTVPGCVTQAKGADVTRATAVQDIHRGVMWGKIALLDTTTASVGRGGPDEPSQLSRPLLPPSPPLDRANGDGWE